MLTAPNATLAPVLLPVEPGDMESRVLCKNSISIAGREIRRRKWEWGIIVGNGKIGERHSLTAFVIGGTPPLPLD